LASSMNSLMSLNIVCLPLSEDLPSGLFLKPSIAEPIASLHFDEPFARAPGAAHDLKREAQLPSAMFNPLLKASRLLFSIFSLAPKDFWISFLTASALMILLCPIKTPSKTRTAP
jgi:hypothetical protein